MAAAGQEGIDVEKHIKSLAVASGKLSPAEVEACHRACEVGKAVARKSQQSLVLKHANTPMLQSSSADGTPKATAYRKTFKLEADGSSMRRDGKRTAELFCMANFIRVICPGTCITKALIRDPHIHG